MVCAGAFDPVPGDAEELAMGTTTVRSSRLRLLAAALGLGAVMASGLITLNGAGVSDDAVAGHMGPMPTVPTYMPTQAPGMSLGSTAGVTTTTTTAPVAPG
jgi:hypothetical protein